VSGVGHPLPGARSLEAGAALLAFIDTTPRDEALLFLISGGTSSLVEVPVPGVDAGGLPLSTAGCWGRVWTLPP
jgi:glycerate 2-kinase